MKCFLLPLLLVSCQCVYAQTLWTGPKVSFSKGDFADWTQAENQDRISDSVWLTRADNKGIFNIVQEAEYDKVGNGSPTGTEWALGSIADGIENLEFDTWLKSIAGTPPEDVGVAKVLQLIDEDIYIDIRFTGWTQGGGGSGTSFGGGFSYERSTSSLVNTNEATALQIDIFPIPSSDFIRILGLRGQEQYTIFNLAGIKLLEGVTYPNVSIDIQQLEVGIYFIQLSNGITKKLVKS